MGIKILSKNLGLASFSALLFLLLPATLFASKGDMEELLLFFEEEALIQVATLHPHPEMSAPAALSVITAEEIADRGARNLPDILAMVPGFGLQTSQGWSRKEFEVRGVGGVRDSEKVLILINGHKLNDPFFGGATAVTDDFPLDHVKQIEIIRGPSSALYGANAFVAVINIVTRKGEELDGGTFTFGGGSFQTTRYNLLYGRKKEKFSYSLSFNHLSTKGDSLFIARDALTETPTGISEAPGFTRIFRERNDLYFDGEYGAIRWMALFIDQDRGSLIGARDHLGDDTDIHFRSLYSEVSYENKDFSHTALTQKVYYNRFDLRFLFELFPEGTPGNDGRIFDKGALYRGGVTDHTWGYNFQIDFSRYKDHLLTLGAVWENIEQDNVTTWANFDPLLPPPSSLTDFRNYSTQANFNKEVRHSHGALYFQDDWTPFHQLHITGGVRYDNYEKIGGAASPRLALVYTPRKNINGKLLYGEAFRVPSLEELHNQNNKGVLGNADLKPEKLRDLEGGIEVRFLEKYRLSLTLYQMWIKDLIRLQPTPPPRTFENLDKVNTRGVEGEIKMSANKKSYLYGNYSYQEAVNGETGTRLPDAPSHRGNLGINLKLGSSVNFHPHLFFSGERLRAPGDNRKKLAPYALVNLALRAENLFGGIEVRADVHNLLDRQVVHPSTPSLPGDYPQEGMAFRIEALLPL